MIQTREDIRAYFEADRLAFGKPESISLKKRVASWLFPDTNYRCMQTLRKLEYYLNKSPRNIYILQKKLARLRYKTGIELMPNVAGPGLHIPHGKVVISAIAKIGSGCKILSDVTIGAQGRYDVSGAPVIGDRVFISSGARIIGNIHISDDCVIGANAVVIHDIDEPNTTWVGIPARKISDTGSYHYLNRG